MRPDVAWPLTAWPPLPFHVSPSLDCKRTANERAITGRHGMTSRVDIELETPANHHLRDTGDNAPSRRRDYWLYYPDSKTVGLGSDKAWETAWLLPRLAGIVEDAPTYPGLHRDDWESFQVRLDPDGDVWVRSSSHGHYQGCKWSDCRNRWFPGSGWTRVSRGSHAGHIPAEGLAPGPPPDGPRPLVRGAPLREGQPGDVQPPGAPPPARHRPLLPGRDLHERTTTAEGLRLIPLETLDIRRYRRLDEGVKPPWEKDVYNHPESSGS